MSAPAPAADARASVFARLSIRWKLMAIIVATTALCTLLVVTGISINDRYAVWRDLVERTSIAAGITGINSTAALVFGDRRAAAETLEALRAQESIVAAALYDQDGELFARLVRREGAADRVPPRPPAVLDERFERGELVLWRPVLLDGERVGTVLIRADTRELRARLARFAAAAAGFFALSVAIALAVSTRLPRPITEPIGELARTAEVVSRTKDYAQRVPEAGPDEIGALVRSFNEMLAEIQKRDEALGRAVGEAREAVRVRDAFLSMASHELKTPLTALLMEVQVSLRIARRPNAPPIPPERLLERFENFERHARQIEKLINGLLDVSRIQAGRLEIVPAEMDLVELAREVIERSSRESRGREEVRLEAPASLVGRWDRFRIDQVLTNLLSNARKYGAGKPIHVTLTRVDDVARLAVRDNGIGIAAEDQARIFERFERAVSTQHYGGLGLGLWIVRQLIEAHGGTIRVRSAPGEGAEFTVELPLAGPPPPPPPAAPQDGEGPAAAEGADPAGFVHTA